MDISGWIEYAIRQDLPNQLVTTVLLIIIYPFVSKEDREHYILVGLVPAYVGSLFPDVFYAMFVILFSTNVRNLSHDPSFLVVLMPLAQIIVFTLSKMFRKKLPENWYLFTGLISIAMGWLHLFVDKLGY